MLESPTRLKIAAPERMSFATIEALVRRHEHWLARQVSLLRSAPPLYISAQRSFVQGEIIPYLGFSLRLQITHDASQRQGCTLASHRLIVNWPDEDEYPQLYGRREAIRLEVLLWLKRRARQKLARRLDIWAQRMGARYARMSMGNAERRWGSCTSSNDIRLNWRLVMAPLPLLDYVVVHELAHVFHKDHSKRFWGLVGQFVPDYRARRNRLQAIGDRLVL
ncbi:MAG: SprT family zinc-dependent metalloprotease [Bdellovibrionales bacterium]